MIAKFGFYFILFLTFFSYGFSEIEFLSKDINSTTYGSGSRFFSTGNWGYSISPGNGFYSIDISDKNNPLVVGNFSSSLNFKDLFVEGRYAYVLSSSRLSIFDISDRYNINLINYFENSTFFAGGKNFKKVEDLIYIPSNDADSILVLNISNVLNISQIGYISDPLTLGDTFDIEVYDDLVFATSKIQYGSPFPQSYSKVSIYNFSNLSNIIYVSNISVSTGTNFITNLDFDSSDLLLFVGTYDFMCGGTCLAYLNIYNVSDISNVSLISSNALSESTTRVFYDDNYLYGYGRSYFTDVDWVYSHNVSTSGISSNPIFTNNSIFGGTGYDVYEFNQVLYVLVNNSLVLFNVSDYSSSDMVVEFPNFIALNSNLGGSSSLFAFDFTSVLASLFLVGFFLFF
jgi:hypothetical protein